MTKGFLRIPIHVSPSHVSLAPAGLDQCFAGFAEDGFGQDPQVGGDFGRVAAKHAFSTVSRQERHFRTAKLTRLQVLLHDREHHRRKLLVSE